MKAAGNGREPIAVLPESDNDDDHTSTTPRCVTLGTAQNFVSLDVLCLRFFGSTRIVFAYGGFDAARYRSSRTQSRAIKRHLLQKESRKYV